MAREAASLVLLDDDFSSIVAAVRLGRRIFDNIKKAVAFIFAVHVPIAGLSLLPVFFAGWPLLLLPVHIVFLELIIDPSCTLVFEAEAAEADVMRRPPRDPAERLFTWRSVAVPILLGLGVLAACVAVFLLAPHDHGADTARALTFTTLVISLIAVILATRSTEHTILGTLRLPNPALWWVVGGAAVFLALVLALPQARRLFHFGPLHLGDLVVSAAAGVACVAWVDLLKLVRRQAGGAR